MVQKRILVRAPQWLGDAVVSTVFLKRLRAQQPDSHIVVACGPAQVLIFSTQPEVDDVAVLPYPDGNVFDAAKQIAFKKCDTAYILPRSFRAALETWLAKIPGRIGYAGDGRRLLLTTALEYDPQRLYAHRYLKLINEEAFSLENVSPYFPEEMPTEEKRQRLFGPASDLTQPVLGIAPVSIAPSRTWDPERFAAAANEFLEKNGGSIVLFGSAKEKTITQKIASMIKGPVFDTAGELTLSELGWLIRRCRFFLGNDSGLMHVASAFKVPSVVLFGASDPNFAIPPWGRCITVQHKEIFCVPCLRNHCVRFGENHNACLKAISISEVSAALQKLI